MRRLDDEAAELLIAAPGPPPTGSPHAEGDAPATLQLFGYRVDPRGPHFYSLPDPSAPRGDVTLLLDVGGPHMLFVAGASVRRIAKGRDHREMLERAALGTLTWKQERLRVSRRIDLVDRVIAYTDRLSEAVSPDEIYHTLVESAVAIVGGYGAVLILRESEDGPLYVRSSTVETVRISEMTVTHHPRFSRPGILRASDASAETGSPFAHLASLFTDLKAVSIAHQPVGDEAVLFLLERRRGRLFEAEDWDLLRTLAKQAATALERTRLIEEVRQLSLTDPLTGLGNRRHLDLMLTHSLAAARRGEPLALVMIDLDGFKAVNDRFGHLRGDELLRRVADALRSEARGSDLVARFGGDEFVIVLPGGTSDAAELLLQRVRSRLGIEVRFSAGIAEYGADAQTVEELIGVADRTLYQNRVARS